MHDAYKAIPVFEKLPLQIESIAAYDHNLLVGTKQGHLLMYKFTVKSSTGEHKSELIRSNKFFSKKAICQMEIIPELQILVTLSDNVVTVHDIMASSFPLINTVSKTRGATLFALDVQRKTTETGENVCILRMCAAVKRKLQLFYWKKKGFEEFGDDLSVTDVPKTMVWCQDSLCLGFKQEYSLIKMNGDLQDLFLTGKSQDPKITKLQKQRLALGRDEKSIIIDSKGQPIKKYPIVWSDSPVVLAEDPPYLIGVLSNQVEVRTIDPRQLIQSIELVKPKFITHTQSGQVYVASTSHVWCLQSIPIPDQITHLEQEKQFELALKLVQISDLTEQEKCMMVQRIENFYAFDLVCKMEFKSAMDIFVKLGTDPSHVIGLFPDLLPQDYRSQLEYPDALPNFEGINLEAGLLALVEYLTEVRHSLMSDLNQPLKHPAAIMEGGATIKNKHQLLQIIDTTLIKCYLKTNDALVSSLLRLPDNHCHIEETERALKKHQKYDELIILYQNKGLHKKALELLYRQSQKPDSPLRGCEKTVHYLQHLGKDHLDLVFEFSSWVLKLHPEDGLMIFLEDTQEIEALPRQKVLEFLIRTRKECVIPYLEHVMYNWKDTTSLFHNTLVHKYREKVSEMFEEYRASLPEGQLPARAGCEPGELGELRQKLIKFLESSSNYTAETLPSHFLNDNLYEERAIVMGKLGHHEEALNIYINILGDPQRAENYCIKNHDPSKEGSKDVFVILLKMHLCSPAITTSMDQSREGTSKVLRTVLRILNDHSKEIDPLKVISLLPDSTPLSFLRSFLTSALQSKIVLKRNAQILKSLLYAEHLQVQERRIDYQSEKFVVDDFHMCPVCRKRIGTSAFARFPSSVIVHYSCKEKYTTKSV